MMVIRLFAAASLLALPGCLEDSENTVSQEDFEYLEEDARVLQEDLTKAYAELDEYDDKFKVFEELEKKAETAEQKSKELEELQKEKEAVEQQMRDLRKEYEDYQKKYEAKVRSEAVGEEREELALDGRTLKKVVIHSVSETKVKVKHADGFSTLDSSKVPSDWKERFFLRSEEEIAQRAAELAAFLNPPVEAEADQKKSAAKPLTSYQKSRLEREKAEMAFELLDEKVGNCLVSVKRGEVVATGFFVQDGITTYLYTSARVLAQVGELQIVGKNGSEWKKFGDLEVAANLDLARLVMNEPVDHVLTLQSSGQEVEERATVAVFSLEKGHSSLVKTKAKIRSVQGSSYQVSPSQSEDSVGGPIVDTSGQVLAFVTLPLEERTSLWNENQFSSARKRVIISRLDHSLQWSKSTFARFGTASQRLEDFDTSSRLLLALSKIRPNLQGLNLETRVGRGPTISETLKEYKKIDVLSAVTRLDNDLTEKRVNMKQPDLNRKLRTIFQSALDKERKQKLVEKEFSPYHWPTAQESLQLREEAISALFEALDAVKR